MAWTIRACSSDYYYVAEAADGSVKYVKEKTDSKLFDSETAAKEFIENQPPESLKRRWGDQLPAFTYAKADATSFTVTFWEAVFGFLSRFSLFGAFRSATGKLRDGSRLKALGRSYVFPEVWVLAWSLLALVAVFAAVYCEGMASWVAFILAILGGIRIAETVVYQINVVLLDEYRARRAGRPYAVRSYRRLVMLAIHNYVEILLWFAAYYALNSSKFISTGGLHLQTFWGAVYQSVLTMTTLGYGDTYPAQGQWLAGLIVASETVIGVFLAIIVLARMLALVPKPSSIDEYE